MIDSVLYYIPNLFIGLGIIIGYIVWDKSNNTSVDTNILLWNLIFGGIFAALFQNFYYNDFEYLGKYGFTFYGGFIGLILSTYVYFKFNWKDSLSFLNLIIDPLLITHSIWRIACFSGGCCYGIVLNAKGLKVPVQLFESFFLFLGFMYSHKKIFHTQKLLFYMLFYPFIRFFLEFLRGDPRGFFLINIFSPSQVISMFLFLIGLFYFYNSKIENNCNHNKTKTNDFV